MCYLEMRVTKVSVRAQMNKQVLMVLKKKENKKMLSPISCINYIQSVTVLLVIRILYTIQPTGFAAVACAQMDKMDIEDST